MGRQRAALILLVFVAAMTATPAGQAGGARVRYQIVLDYKGVWGLVSNEHGACPGGQIRQGHDTLTGTVEGFENASRSDDGAGIRYEGVLTRTTDVGLCESTEGPSGTLWCGGHLNGGGAFKVTITVPDIEQDNEEAAIVLSPASSSAGATVTGTCDSLDNAAVAADYKAGDTLYFETANASGTGLLPTGGLQPGTYGQTRRLAPGDPGHYTLRVQQVP